MLYQEDDLKEVCQTYQKRVLWTWFPASLFLIASIIVYVIEKSNRSISMWWLSTLLTVIGGGIAIFGYGVYIKPAKIYREHIGYMLGKDQRSTEGFVKSISDDVSVREGLSCRAVIINIGNVNDEEDDRLFYVDIYKDCPKTLVEKKVRILSNNKMISSIEMLDTI